MPAQHAPAVLDVTQGVVEFAVTACAAGPLRPTDRFDLGVVVQHRHRCHSFSSVRRQATRHAIAYG
jgi:hypothetical protein